MPEKEDWLERYQRLASEAREQAAIRELERRIEAGEFPDNEDTVKAFAAGFYTAYTFQWEQKVNSTQPGESSRMGSVMLTMVGAMMIAAYGFVWYSGVKMAPQAPVMLIGGAFLLAVSLFLSKRSKRIRGEADNAFADKWGKKEKSDV